MTLEKEKMTKKEDKERRGRREWRRKKPEQEVKRKKNMKRGVRTVINCNV